MKKIGLNPITAKLGLLTLSGSFAISSHAAIVINEIDYDQPGIDTAEFIELYNSGSSVMPLDSFSIALINGTNAESYRNIELTGFSIEASSFFVVCSDTTLVANCNYRFTTSSSWLQNGAPDAVALYSDSNLLDSFSYEGILLPFTEGNPAIINDNNIDITSISRVIDGVDSNDNAFDFQLGCITPGSPNVGGMGDCSLHDISAVPVPAAAWLFGSGLIGIAGLARRK